MVQSFWKIWKFFLVVLALISVTRAVVITLLYLLNLTGLPGYNISWKWLVIIITGGVRGAVSFALVSQIPEERKDRAEEFRDTTVLIILVTTVFNGILLKLLPWLLNITETGKDAKNINKDEDADLNED